MSRFPQRPGPGPAAILGVCEEQNHLGSLSDTESKLQEVGGSNKGVLRQNCENCCREVRSQAQILCFLLCNKPSLKLRGLKQQLIISQTLWIDLEVSFAPVPWPHSLDCSQPATWPSQWSLWWPPSQDWSLSQDAWTGAPLSACGFSS